MNLRKQLPFISDRQFNNDFLFREGERVPDISTVHGDICIGDTATLTYELSDTQYETEVTVDRIRTGHPTFQAPYVRVVATVETPTHHLSVGKEIRLDLIAGHGVLLNSQLVDGNALFGDNPELHA